MSDRARNFARVALLAIAVAVGTWVLGWWAVPLIGAVWGVLQRGRPRFRTAALAGFWGWHLLTLYNVSRGAAGSMASLLGDIVGVGGWGMIAVMILYPTLLAGCAAQVAGVARRPRPAP